MKLCYDKAPVKNVCKLVYARKLMKARELQFLGGAWTEFNLSQISDLKKNTHTYIYRRNYFKSKPFKTYLQTVKI